MPKQHKSGEFKQKNKPFKGSSKRNVKERLGKIVKKQIQKTPAKQMTQEKQQEQKIQKEDFTLLIKQTKQPRIVAVIPFNQEADTLRIKKQINEALGQSDAPVTTYISQGIFSKVEPSKQINYLKKGIQFIFLNRDVESILDACKVADVIVPVLSCSNVNLDGITLDPIGKASAFDTLGYWMLTSLRTQGLLNQVCVIQDLETIPQSKRAQVKKIFTRYFQSEFSDDVSIHSLENSGNVNNLLRAIQNTQDTPQEWRDTRGYMLPEDIQFLDNELSITGIWRGKQGLSPQQLIHITGLDDFQISRIKLIRNRQVVEEENVLHRDEEKGETLEYFSKKNEDITGDFLDQLNGLGLGEDFQNKDQNEMVEEEQEEIQEEQLSDVSYDEEEKRELQEEIDRRKDDELEFEDEVEYGMEVQLRDRYSKYQGLKNLTTASFDPLTFLPDEVDRIFNIRNLVRVKQNVLDDHKKLQQFEPGLRIQIFLKGFPDHLLDRLRQPNKIIILSANLQYERKLTQMHAKFKRMPESVDPIISKDKVIVQIGFKRGVVEPIYSRILAHSSKTKYVKAVKDDSVYLASFYFSISFPPQKVLYYQNNTSFSNAVLLGSGDVLKCDAFHLIMKRVLLTGYPYKINKRKAVVRMMFFNPNDVRYFKPVDLNTKLGLKGNIIEPLGTHGLMKCMFNNFVKPNDTICLPLYKRVHPRFPKDI